MFGEFKDEESLKSEITSIDQECSFSKMERARAIKALEKYLTSNAIQLSAEGNKFVENIPFSFNQFMCEQ